MLNLNLERSRDCDADLVPFDPRAAALRAPPLRDADPFAWRPPLLTNSCSRARSNRSAPPTLANGTFLLEVRW